MTEVLYENNHIRVFKLHMLFEYSYHILDKLTGLRWAISENIANNLIEELTNDE